LNASLYLIATRTETGLSVAMCQSTAGRDKSGKERKENVAAFVTQGNTLREKCRNGSLWELGRNKTAPIVLLFIIYNSSPRVLRDFSFWYSKTKMPQHFLLRISAN
jgi:hypothetical protein